MADYSDPKRATAYRFALSLYARSDNQIKTAPTLAAGDVKVSKDNGATANITTLPAETPASSGILQVDLSATEMTADLVTIIFRDAAGDEWNDVAVHIAPSTVQMADLATAAALTTVDDLLDTEVAAIKTVVDAILVDTAEIGAAGAGLTALATQTSVNTIDDFLDTEIATIVSQTTAANIRAAVGLASANLDTQLSTIDNFVDTEIATLVSQTSAASIRSAVGLASANLDTQIGTLATAAALATVDDFIDTEVATIVSQTSAASIRSAVGLASANLDTQIGDIPTNAELATSQAAADDATLAAIAALSIPTAAVIADAVWGEAIAGHLTAGTTGATLNGAGSAGDPWSTALPGAYAAGTAGKIVGDNINATISSRASQASLDTVDDLLDTEIASIIASIGTVENLGTGATLAKNLRDIGGATFDSTTDTLEAVRNRVVTIDALLDTEIAAILADTNELQTDWADGGRLDLLIDAINAKTTNLPSDPADASVIAGRFDTLDTSVADLPTNAELATALAAADDAVLAAIAALNNLSAAQVNAEVVDALATDTYAEPGQGTPGATISLAAKVNYIYKALRNKSTVTATEHSIFNDDAVTVDHKRTISDDATTFTSGELTTGP